MLKNGWTNIPLGDVLEPAFRLRSVKPEEKYRLLGVRLEGRGAFHRETKLGVDISAKTLNQVENGDFIYSRLFAWRGAFSLIDQMHSGCYVSNEFPVFRPRDFECLDLKFLSYWFRLSEVWKIVEEDCQGSTPLTRNRYKEEFFLRLRAPLPYKTEQKRIVAHLEEIEKNLSRVHKLHALVEKASNALIINLHDKLSGKHKVSVNKLLYLDEEKESVVPDGSYPQVGIRSFGKGLFTKSAVAGSETSYKTFNTLRKGKLVLSQVKGWEGAVAVCPDNLDGWYVSPEYRTFSCRESQCSPEYLTYIVSTEWFQKYLLSATRGVGARRERVRPEMFLSIELPFPEIDKQIKAIGVLSKINQTIQLSNNIIIKK